MAQARVAGGIALAVFGFFLLIAGGLVYTACTAPPPPGVTVTADCGSIGVLIGIGVFLLVLGIVLAIAARGRYTWVPPSTDPAVPPPLINPVVVQQTVEKQVVMVRCRYCGTLADPAGRTCPSCGAPL